MLHFAPRLEINPKIISNTQLKFSSSWRSDGQGTKPNLQGPNSPDLLTSKQSEVAISLAGVGSGRLLVAGHSITNNHFPVDNQFENVCI